MAESNVSTPRRVGGNPTFRTAHEVVKETGLHFEHAYALAKLVLEEDGGPVTSRGKNATIKKPTEDALSERGLIEVYGASNFIQHSRVEAITDARIDERPNAKFAGVKATPSYANQRAKWTVVATKAGIDLVNACLAQA